MYIKYINDNIKIIIMKNKSIFISYKKIFLLFYIKIVRFNKI